MTEVRPRAIGAEEAREWLLAHLASAPERDDAWYARVLSICDPEGSQPASLMPRGEP